MNLIERMTEKYKEPAMKSPNWDKCWAGLARILPLVLERDKLKNGPLFAPTSGKDYRG